MALQEDPTKTFGSTSYFKNKDDQRKAVNETRQTERQKRIATQLLRRNMKKSMRAGGDGGNFMQAAKLGKLDIFGSNGLGEEAGAAMARARYDVDQNFQAAAKAKAQKDAGMGNAGQTPAINTGATTPTGSTPQTGVAPPANATPPPPVSGQATTQTADSKPVSTRPDWADEVANDSTFKDVNDKPIDLARFQGKTRAEAYDILRKEQAARFMSVASKKGNEMKAQEAAQQEAEIKLAAEAQAKKEKGIFDGKVKGKVDAAIKNAQTIFDSSGLLDVSGMSKADTDAYNSALNTAELLNKQTSKLSTESYNLLGTTRKELAKSIVPTTYSGPEYQTPSADYYSMSLEEQVADHFKRSKNYDSGVSTTTGTAKQYEYEILDNGEIKVVLNPNYKSKESETLQQLKSESQDPNSTLMKNTGNLVLAEAKAEKEREFNKYLQSETIKNYTY
jgi:hypothetical protein